MVVNKRSIDQPKLMLAHDKSCLRYYWSQVLKLEGLSLPAFITPKVAGYGQTAYM